MTTEYNQSQSRMAQTASKKLVVCGGNGFLGSRICKAAALRGWTVTSLSRSGEPKWLSVTASATAPSWSGDVKWQKANILQPSTYRDELESADAVVHSMGILLETDYKGLISGQESLQTGLAKAFTTSKSGATGNPLQEQPGTPIQPGDGQGKLTYELMNRDSAILLARETADKKVPTFVYLSADAGFPLLPNRYIESKRAAESSIASAFPKMRSLFFRPAFMYDSSRSYTLPIAGFGHIASMVNSAVGGFLSPIMGAGGTKPLKADQVAEAIVEAIEEENITGVVSVPQIEELAQRAWRKGMT